MTEHLSSIVGESMTMVDVFNVSDDTVTLISKMRESVQTGDLPSEKLLAGDILRRTCRLAGNMCAASGCQAPDGYVNGIDKLCSDMNLSELFDTVGIARDKVLMVGVTADNVGFYDELKASKTIKTNSVGVKEIAGYNAFFAKESDEIVLGARLADCGYAAIEFKSGDGETVRGFVHLTRPNLQGDTALKFEKDGQATGCFDFFLSKALEHYDGHLDEVKVRVIAGIKAENSPYTFSNEEKLEELFPGWFADGLIENVDNSAWRSGEPFSESDTWLPNYRDMVMKQILKSGLAPDQVETAGMIDPADLELGHASNHAGAHGKMPDARDAYLVVPSRF